MSVYTGVRQTGKTTRLLREVAEKKGLLVTSHLSMIQSYLKKAEDLGLVIRTPILFEDLMNDQKFEQMKIDGIIKDNDNTYIDEAEAVLAHHFYTSRGIILESIVVGSGLGRINVHEAPSQDYINRHKQMGIPEKEYVLGVWKGEQDDNNSKEPK